MMSDLIDRQAAIDALKMWLNVKGYNEGEINMLKACINELESVPPAELSTNLAEVGTMTNAEAIDVIRDYLVNKVDNELMQKACQLAIKALSAEPQIIHCRDCKNLEIDSIFHDCWCNGHKVWLDHYCGYAERKTDV